MVLLEAGYSVTIIDNLNNAVRGPRPPPPAPPPRPAPASPTPPLT